MILNIQMSSRYFTNMFLGKSANPMPLTTRRKHHKSRRGCTTCKQRHIRCDEAFPSCLNCFKHRSACHYPEAHYQAISRNTFLVQSQGDKRKAPTELAFSLAKDRCSESGGSVAVAQTTRSGPEPSKTFPRSLGSYLGVSTTITHENIQQLAVCK